MKKKIIIITAITLACIVGFVAIIVGGYVGYVALQYYRIDDHLPIDISGSANTTVKRGENLSVMTYNLGFGSYSPEYSFFMDTGVMDDGTAVAGIYAKGMNKEDVQKNVDGQIALSKKAGADFYFFQEADEKADRSYNINMKESLYSAFGGYCATYAENFHTAWLLYPFNDPMGTTKAGIVTVSKYKVDSAVRRSFPLTDNFIDRLFDLDRCFAVHYLPVEGTDKQLVMINLHMSAYDEGGTVRARQLEMLNGVLAEEYKKGNYVIAGGDFNHCLIADSFESDEQAFLHFESKQKVPDWVKNSVLHKSEIAQGFSICADKDTATCRGADIPYEKGVNFTTTIDGFLISDNIEMSSVKTVANEFAYSDHNPVIMEFELK